jgi:hypothetical protein
MSMRTAAYPPSKKLALWVFVLVAIAGTTIVVAWKTGLLAFSGPAIAAVKPAKPLEKSSDLFTLTNIWTVHLKFSQDQWLAMEPQGGSGFGGPGRFRGPARPSESDPGPLLAPEFIKQSDLNGDGKISKEEFQKRAEQWFSDWDAAKSGKLGETELQAGLNRAFPSSNLGARRGQGMNLQGPEGKRNGIAAAMGFDYQYARADLEFENRSFKDVGVRYKGGGTFLESRGSVKRSLKVSLNHYEKGRKLAGRTTLNLHNNVTDASWMNDVLSHRLYRDAGVPAPRTAYARVFVTVPGIHNREYFGLYSLVENIDKQFTEEISGAKSGAIFKPVTPDMFGYLGDDWRDYRQSYDPKTTLTPEQMRRMIEFCAFVTKAGDAEFAAKLGDFIDLDEFARFMAVMVFLSDLDGMLGPGQNFYVHLDPKTGKLVFIPWDQDHSFGQFGMRGTQEQRENLSIRKPWQDENRFLDRVFKVDAFKSFYLARLEEYAKTLFQPERLARQVDELALAIRPAVKEESEDKLARFNNVVSGKPLETSGFGRFGMRQPLKPIKPFVKIRSRSIADQLAGRADGMVLGEFGFGRWRGGPRPGGPEPGSLFSGPFMEALDADQDRLLTHDEFMQGFSKLFNAWNNDKSGLLTEEQLRAGISKAFAPSRANPPGGPGFAPPAERPDDGH